MPTSENPSDATALETPANSTTPNADSIAHDGRLNRSALTASSAPAPVATPPLTSNVSALDRTNGDGTDRNTACLTTHGANFSPSFTGVPSVPTEEQLREAERPARFAALRHRNFRLFWFGNLVSVVGTLAQSTAQGWLVRLLTSDPQTIAQVAICGTVPISLLTLYAGVLADRVDKRRALIVTNSLAAVLAVALAALVHWHLIRVWHVAALSFLNGIVIAFDIPIRQSYNIEMVGRDDLPNAIALNSTAFNSARVVGPAVGGFLMGAMGMAGCFLANAFSFLALIVGLLMQHWPSLPATPVSAEAGGRRSSLGRFPEGLSYVWHHETLRLVTLLVAVVSVMAMQFGTLLPVFARDVFGSDAHGFARLMTSNGLGAMGSALSLAVAGQMRHRGKRLLLGAFLYCLSVMAFAMAPNLTVGYMVLVLAGWFLMTFLMTANTMVQTLAPDELRGRVVALYSFALIGLAPLGMQLVGSLAKAWGPREAVQFSAGLAAAFVLAAYLRFRGLWKEK